MEEERRKLLKLKGLGDYHDHYCQLHLSPDNIAEALLAAVPRAGPGGSVSHDEFAGRLADAI